MNYVRPLSILLFAGAVCTAALMCSGCATAPSHPYYNRFRQQNHDRTVAGNEARPTPADVKVATSAPRPTPSAPVTSQYSPRIPERIVGQRFAIVIGVSQYADSRIPPLRYAARDAKAFYDWLVSPSGGRYSPNHVRLLLDKEATAASIRKALFVWAKQAIREDMMTIYIACHGSPESPDSPENLFLIPYDTDFANIASTAFPMWDIETALRKRFINAGTVAIIADACHSGGVGAEFLTARRGIGGVTPGLVSSGLADLSEVSSRESTQDARKERWVFVLTASGTNELSQESPQWGGGHGVFTYFLLEGLRGAADYNKDGRVTWGELVPFVSEKVRRATRSKQRPVVSGKYDPSVGLAR